MEALIYLLKSSAILGLFYLIYIVFLHKETFFKANRIYLVTGVFVALILPFVSIKKTIYVTSVPPLTLEVLNSDKLAQLTTATEPTALVNWIYVFGVLYVLGIVLMLSKVVIQIISVFHENLQIEVFKAKTD